MALTIEDGSKVAGANSYITAAEYIAWADARFGDTRSTAPADEAAAEPLILRAMDFFEELSFLGVIVLETQPLQWPRLDVWIDGYYVESNEIPKQVKNALYELAYAEELSISELATVERKVKSEKIGPVSVTYEDNSASRDYSPGVHRALRKLIRTGSGIKVSRA